MLVADTRRRVPLDTTSAGAWRSRLRSNSSAFPSPYLTLERRAGALILFSAWCKFASSTHGALFRRPRHRQIAGAAVAFAGLVLVPLASQEFPVDPLGAALMIAAGLGWAAYTTSAGRNPNPLQVAAGNFVMCPRWFAVLAACAATSTHRTGMRLAWCAGR